MSTSKGWADHGLRTITDAEWQRLRTATLKRDRHRCQLLFAPCIGRATEADHILPVYTHPHLQADPSNLAAVCKPCHEIKSRREAIDGAARARAKAKMPVERHPGLI